MNEAQGWSIVVPTGWEVVADSAHGTALHREQVIAEILLAPSSGLSFEELEAQKVRDLRTWPEGEAIESESVDLPAGDALRVTLGTTELGSSPASAFILYVIEKGDTQYVISVRGPHTKDDLLTEAEALAESFAILD